MGSIETKSYERKAQYYETDQMGIIHHSNYIRWFEEARIDYMDQIGLPYREMEDNQVSIPVLEVQCQYKKMTQFNDIVLITVKPSKYNGITMEIGYIVADKETGEVRCTGETKHCFLSHEGKPVSLKKSYPRWHQIFLKMLP